MQPIAPISNTVYATFDVPSPFVCLVQKILSVVLWGFKWVMPIELATCGHAMQLRSPIKREKKTDNFGKQTFSSGDQDRIFCSIYKLVRLIEQIKKVVKKKQEEITDADSFLAAESVQNKLNRLLEDWANIEKNALPKLEDTLNKVREKIEGKDFPSVKCFIATPKYSWRNGDRQDPVECFNALIAMSNDEKVQMVNKTFDSTHFSIINTSEKKVEMKKEQPGANFPFVLMIDNQEYGPFDSENCVIMVKPSLKLKQGVTVIWFDRKPMRAFEHFLLKISQKVNLCMRDWEKKN